MDASVSARTAETVETDDFRAHGLTIGARSLAQGEAEALGAPLSVPVKRYPLRVLGCSCRCLFSWS